MQSVTKQTYTEADRLTDAYKCGQTGIYYTNISSQLGYPNGMSPEGE